MEVCIRSLYRMIDYTYTYVVCISCNQGFCFFCSRTSKPPGSIKHMEYIRDFQSKGHAVCKLSIHTYVHVMESYASYHECSVYVYIHIRIRGFTYMNECTCIRKYACIYVRIRTYGYCLYINFTSHPSLCYRFLQLIPN